ncbi:MAG: MBL fold metallo-hydrolase [Patescibacteria group bacterium]|nr:MBL fold metallo-hydrolase [Patescibacteria group bacterium]
MFDVIVSKLVSHKNKVIIFLTVLAILDFLVFWQIIIVAQSLTSQDLKIYFFDVGQGDSQLVLLPGGVKTLIDGGPPNGRVLEQLAKVLPPTDRYIDLVIMSHPQLDHLGGLIEVLKRYRVGVFLWNGREGSAEAFSELERALQENSVGHVILAKGDRIHYRDSHFNVIMPTTQFLESKELNDTSLVLELLSKESKTLFTGDIGTNVEKELLGTYKQNIDILKVAHHGSKYSSVASFLQAVKPKVAVIEVGRNSYGHPTRQVLDRLQDIGASIYRTDQDGTVQLVIDGKSIKVFR